MPSTIVVAIPEGQEPSFNTALKVAAAAAASTTTATGEAMKAGDRAAVSTTAVIRNGEITEYDPPPKWKRNKKICSHPTCPNMAISNNVCFRHGANKQFRRCSVDGCRRYVVKRGICWKHGAYALCAARADVAAGGGANAKENKKASDTKLCQFEEGMAKKKIINKRAIQSVGGTGYSSRHGVGKFLAKRCHNVEVEGSGNGVCSAMGCKNEPFVGGLCLVHGTKKKMMATLSYSHDSAAAAAADDTNSVKKKKKDQKVAKREITPVRESDVDDDTGKSDLFSSCSSNDAVVPSSSSSNKNNKHEERRWPTTRQDWPFTNISNPGNNDCLFGRGGGTNHHPGNKKYRKLVEYKKDVYLQSIRYEKTFVAMEVVNIWRAMDPPGRFLQQDMVTKLWNDVGDAKAREKTSQALREKIPVAKSKKRERECILKADYMRYMAERAEE